MSHPRPLSRAIALATLLTMGSATLASGQPPTSDVVREWNAIMVATVSGQNPFAQGRFAAITQLAVFDAVNAIERRHVPYLPGTVAPPGASAAAAAVAAAHKTLVTYFPLLRRLSTPLVPSRWPASPTAPPRIDGIMVGESAAAAIIAHRAADGSAPPQFHLPVSAEPGEWQLTPSCPAAGGVLKHWQFVTPFGIDSASQFSSPPPPALDSRIYARESQRGRGGGRHR